MSKIVEEGNLTLTMRLIESLDEALLTETEKLIHSANKNEIRDILADFRNKPRYKDSTFPVGNRAFFDKMAFEMVKSHFTTADSNERGIYFLDIDNFKIFNNKYGHDIGDLVLEKLSLCLGKYLPLARFGGDEFKGSFIVNSHSSLINRINHCMEELNSELEKENVKLDDGGKISGSCGICSFSLLDKLHQYLLGSRGQRNKTNFDRFVKTIRASNEILDTNTLASRKKEKVNLYDKFVEARQNSDFRRLVDRFNLGDLATFALIRAPKQVGDYLVESTEIKDFLLSDTQDLTQIRPESTSSLFHFYNWLAVSIADIGVYGAKSNGKAGVFNCSDLNFYSVNEPNPLGISRIK